MLNVGFFIIMNVEFQNFEKIMSNIEIIKKFLIKN
jgi:hypothetical protein